MKRNIKIQTGKRPGGKGTNYKKKKFKWQNEGKKKTTACPGQKLQAHHPNRRKN